MSFVATDPLETMIREAGEGWLIDWYSPPGQAIPHLREKLRRADEIARATLGPDTTHLTPEALIAAYALNPHKVRAFLQVAGSNTTAGILVMVWRILEGFVIAELGVQYACAEPFHLRVKLLSMNAEKEEVYESSDIHDAVVLRHLGVMTVNGGGIFEGFYALNVRGK